MGAELSSWFQVFRGAAVASDDGKRGRHQEKGMQLLIPCALQCTARAAWCSIELCCTARGAVSGQSSHPALAINHLPTLPVKAEAFLSASASPVGTNVARGSACTHTSSSITPGVRYSEGFYLLRLRPAVWALHLTVSVPPPGISLLLTPQQLCPAREVPAAPGAAASTCGCWLDFPADRARLTAVIMAFYQSFGFSWRPGAPHVPWLWQ